MREGSLLCDMQEGFSIAKGPGAEEQEGASRGRLFVPAVSAARLHRSCDGALQLGFANWSADALIIACSMNDIASVHE